jgi:hypothetical protein
VAGSAAPASPTRRAVGPPGDDADCGAPAGPGPNTWAATEQALGLLRQAGHSDADAARIYQTLLFYTLGHVALEAPYAALDPEQAADEVDQYASRTAPVTLGLSSRRGVRRRCTISIGPGRKLPVPRPGNGDQGVRPP